MIQELCPFCEEEVVRTTSVVDWDPREGRLVESRNVYHVNCHHCDWGMMSTKLELMDKMVEITQGLLPCR